MAMEDVSVCGTPLGKRETGCRYIERVLSMTTGTRTCFMGVCAMRDFRAGTVLRESVRRVTTPLTPGLDEVQLVECTCLEAGGCANNTLALTFKGQRTDPIPADATADLLEYFLEKLSSITDVDVHYDGGGEN